MPEPGRKKNLDLRQCADLGLRMALTVGLLAYGGLKCDEWLGTGRAFLIIGSLVGAAVGMYQVVRAVQDLSAEDGADDPS